MVCKDKQQSQGNEMHFYVQECIYKMRQGNTTMNIYDQFLTFKGQCIDVYSYKKNQGDALITQIYFWNKTLHVSDSISVHHQESSTVHTAIGICHKGYADSLLAGSGCTILIPFTSCQHNLYDIYLLLCVQCQTPNDGQRYCPKHVEFYSKNKFEKLMHLVGFIIRRR